MNRENNVSNNHNPNPYIGSYPLNLYPNQPVPPYPYPVYPYPYQASPNLYNPNTYSENLAAGVKNPLSDSFVQTDPIKISHKPDQQFEFNTLYKKPIDSYEFKAFRESTLPMVRVNKLKKIQALVRGW